MKWNTDRVVSLSAMIVGVGSLFIVLYQTALIREQQKASVLPYLGLTFNSSNEGAFVLLRNMGLGPALIDRVRVRYQGREIDGDAFAFYAGLEPEKSAAENVWVDRVLPGMLVPAGDTKRLLGSTNRALMFSELLRTFEFTGVPSGWVPEEPAPAPGQKAVLEIEYSSVYGDHWLARSDRVVPEPL